MIEYNRISDDGNKVFVLYFQHAGSFFFQIEYYNIDTDKIEYTDP